jgi:hypothetical protein
MAAAVIADFLTGGRVKIREESKFDEVEFGLLLMSRTCWYARLRSRVQDRAEGRAGYLLNDLAKTGDREIARRASIGFWVLWSSPRRQNWKDDMR